MEGLGGGGAGEVVVDDGGKAVWVDGVDGGVKGAFGVPVVGVPELRGVAEAEVAGAGGEGVREGGAGFRGRRREEEKARDGIEEGAGGVVGDVGEEGVEGDDVDCVDGGGGGGGDGGEGGGVDLVEEGAVGGNGGEEWEVGGKGVGWWRVVGGGVGSRGGGEVGGGVGVGGVGGGDGGRWGWRGRVVAGACVFGEGGRAGVDGVAAKFAAKEVGGQGGGGDTGERAVVGAEVLGEG